MGSRIRYHLARLLAIAVLGTAIVGPLHDAASAADSIAPGAAQAEPVRPVRADPAFEHVGAPPPKGFVDDAARVSFDPPVGWTREPSTALNPQSDPPDPAQEIVRFQLRTGDPSLYAQPIPITSALKLRVPAAIRPPPQCAITVGE